MRLTDWRGAEYGVGDIVLYPRMSGRSCEMQEGTVTDIYVAVRDPETYGWKRLAEGATPDGQPTEMRVQILPTRSSREFFRWGVPKPVTLTIVKNVTALPKEAP
ncbi:hypothetical protein [Kitasatospora fiedleri]|uniref:hypothetical protein n=1 Tax=Kitasatospora fiedleri TaxID=2991545 RepID=UPI00249AB3BB|nr:hypothetical protein [Kitasatospora fiedleri]